MKKLVTVTWSVSLETDVEASDIDELTRTEEIKLVGRAADVFNKQFVDGSVTDIREPESYPAQGN